MAVVWSLATIACGLADSYGQMFGARFLVGVGEAAYGSVGLAVVLSIFPAHLRATLAGSFLAGGIFGSVVGMALGGAIGAQLGWRWSFYAMGIFGLVALAAFAAAVTEERVEKARDPEDRAAAATRRFSFRSLLPGLFSARSVVFAYLGSGLQLFIVGSLVAWLPSVLNRYYAMPLGEASAKAVVFVLLLGVGMIACGGFTDRVARNAPGRKFRIAVSFSLCTALLLGVGFRLEPGTAQLVLIGAGIFLAGGTTGPATAMVANVTHPAIHATAFAVLSLANNLLGMAPGPIVTGALADRVGLMAAFQWTPFVCIAAAACFYAAGRLFPADAARL